MPSGSWFCSVLSGAMSARPEIHYDAIGSPLPLPGLEEAEKIGLPKTQALESMECLPVGKDLLCRHPQGGCWLQSHLVGALSQQRSGVNVAPGSPRQLQRRQLGGDMTP